MHDRCTREERRATFGASLPISERPFLDRRYVNRAPARARADARQSHRTCTAFFRQHRFQGTGTCYRRRDPHRPTRRHERRYRRPVVARRELRTRLNSRDGRCRLRSSRTEILFQIACQARDPRDSRDSRAPRSSDAPRLSGRGSVPRVFLMTTECGVICVRSRTSPCPRDISQAVSREAFFIPPLVS